MSASRPSIVRPRTAVLVALVLCSVLSTAHARTTRRSDAQHTHGQVHLLTPPKGQLFCLCSTRSHSAHGPRLCLLVCSFPLQNTTGVCAGQSDIDIWDSRCRQ